MFYTQFKNALLCISLSIWVTSCGEEQQQIVQKFYYDTADNKISFDVEFNKDLSLSTEFTVPILKYGEVRFMPTSDDGGVRVGTTLNLDAIVDPRIVHLQRTRLLPNDQPMSSYVKTDVGRLWIRASADVSTSIYFGVDPNQFYLGTAIELNFLNKDFPSGLVITQKIRDMKNRPLGIVTLFGPKLLNDEVMIAPGGFLIMTNVSDLVRYWQEDHQNVQEAFGKNELLTVDHGLIKPDHDIFVNQKQYQNQEKLQQLMQLYKKKSQDAGFAQ